MLTGTGALPIEGLNISMNWIGSNQAMFIALLVQ